MRPEQARKATKGSCAAGIPLPPPERNQDSAIPDFMRGIEFAIAEVNAVLDAAGTLICFEIGGMDAQDNLPAYKRGR